EEARAPRRLRHGRGIRPIHRRELLVYDPRGEIAKLGAARRVASESGTRANGAKFRRSSQAHVDVRKRLRRTGLEHWPDPSADLRAPEFGGGALELAVDLQAVLEVERAVLLIGDGDDHAVDDLQRTHIG